MIPSGEYLSGTADRGKYPDLPLQSISALSETLAIHGQHLPATILPKEPAVDRARQVHEVWEIDAKERIDLGAEHKACYLNITDEKAVRSYGLRFPLADQSGPLNQITALLLEIFKQWGYPRPSVLTMGLP
ncbi:MAG: hypothetical protein R2824_31785 [Saprospiraceae bacterium]